MSHSFEYQVTPDATEVRLKGPKGTLLVDAWALDAPPSLLAAIDLVQRLIAAGAAIAIEDVIYIEHRAVSGLSAAEAKRLGFPPIVDAVAQLDTAGVITRPDFSVGLQWRRRTGQSGAGG